MLITLISVGLLSPLTQAQASSKNIVVNRTSSSDTPAWTAHAKLDSKSGSNVNGVVDFLETNDGIKVKYKVKGMKKGGIYGFHIHEKGDCSATDAKSAGTHFKQLSDTGGTSTDSPGLHAGDLPEIKAGAKGEAEGEMSASLLNVGREKAHAIEGRTIVIHGGPDDPEKKSAPRVACGEIVRDRVRF